MHARRVITQLEPLRRFVAKENGNGNLLSTFCRKTQHNTPFASINYLIHTSAMNRFEWNVLSFLNLAHSDNFN